MKSIIAMLLFSLISAFGYADQANQENASSSKTSKDVAVDAITQIFLRRNADAVDKYVVEDYVQHQPGLPQGREAFKKYAAALFKAFPDYAGEIENVIAEGDLVSFHLKWSGTHKGEFMGVPPTNKRITRRTADILRIKAGKLVEHWGVVDQVDMLKDLGILTTVKANSAKK